MGEGGAHREGSRFTFTLMNSVSKMLNSVSKMLNFVSKMMNFVSKMMNFAYYNDEQVVSFLHFKGNSSASREFDIDGPFAHLRSVLMLK